MKKILTMCASVMMAAQMLAGGTLNLKDITKGLFRGQTIAAIESCSDGETYMQISVNREQIVRYSYKTGKQVGVVFDVNTVRGDKIKGVDGYVVSPYSYYDQEDCDNYLEDITTGKVSISRHHIELKISKLQ